MTRAMHTYRNIEFKKILSNTLITWAIKSIKYLHNEHDYFFYKFLLFSPETQWKFIVFSSLYSPNLSPSLSLGILKRLVRNTVWLRNLDFENCDVKQVRSLRNVVLLTDPKNFLNRENSEHWNLTTAEKDRELCSNHKRRKLECLGHRITYMALNKNHWLQITMFGKIEGKIYHGWKSIMVT